MRRLLVRRDTYFDSVYLMAMSAELRRLPGVTAGEFVLATEFNQQLLRDQGFDLSDFPDLGPTDLVVALQAADASSVERAESRVDALLRQHPAEREGSAAVLPLGLDSAIRQAPSARLALVSVPGAYAAYEARKALMAGLHVMLFSDNVPLDDEISLKEEASARGLLLMGPDCGTAIIGGIMLGFANKVRCGPVGVVGASGTGIQEVTCLLDRDGVGVSHVVGTGGRDLHERVNARGTRMALEWLARDPDTQVLVLISKPPSHSVADAVLRFLHQLGLPSVVHFVGASRWERRENVVIAPDLEATARAAASLVKGKSRVQCADLPDLLGLARRLRSTKAPSQWTVRGLFSGGTFAAEALAILEGKLGPIDSNLRPQGVRPAVPGHSIVDLGSDEYTRGRPHPMIDPVPRAEMLTALGSDPSVSVVLLDCVLGTGAHPDPAGVLGPAIQRARQTAADQGRELSVVASVTGTDDDAQCRCVQFAKLERSGAILLASNAQAVRLAGAIALGEPMDGVEPAAADADAPDHVHERQSSATPGVTIPAVVNLGLETFADALRSQRTHVVHVAWSPPAGGHPASLAVLSRMLAWPEDARTRLVEANQVAARRLVSAHPTLIDVRPAAEVVPGMHPRLVLHAGPPIDWNRMCGPMRGAVIGALLYEGLARDVSEALRLAASGEIEFAPCHHHDAVGPMAGILTASMPVWVVENRTVGNRSYCTLNEGLGKVLRYGAYSAEVLERLRWIRDELGPALSRVLSLTGALDLRSCIAQALQMGDEGHNRNRAGTSLVLRAFAPTLVESGLPTSTLARVLRFLDSNDHFFLNLTMAACKSAVDSIADVEGSSVISTMARNGTEFGIRVAGMPGRWFVAPATYAEGLYLPGFSAADAAPDIGDSVVTETAGIGGFAMAAAPAIVRFVGGSAAEALRITHKMYEITVAEHDAYQIPALDFRGTPTGIDVRKVVETNTLPAVNTGIAHKDPGVGMVGAGLVRPPIECFRTALEAFVSAYESRWC